MKTVRSAAKTYLATLGQVTWAANNHVRSIVDEKGIVKTKICRDSVSKPPHLSRKDKPSAEVRGGGKTQEEVKETFNPEEVQKIKLAWQRKLDKAKRPTKRKAEKEGGVHKAKKTK